MGLRGRPRRSAGFASAAQVALLPAGALAVHQLRYMLAFGGHASAVLRETGHSYLHSVVPWIVLLLAVVVGLFLRSLGRAFAGHVSLPRYGISVLGMWLACTSALVAIFVCQEFLEGLFALGHPAGWAGIFGYGGWWSIPAAMCVGLVLAVILHGARWLLAGVASRAARARTRWTKAAALAHPNVVVIAPLAPLVGGWSGRGPPG